jgi:hypothetical protein
MRYFDLTLCTYEHNEETRHSVVLSDRTDMTVLLVIPTGVDVLAISQMGQA